MDTTLTALMDLGIVAYPMHDCLILKKSNKDIGVETYRKTINEYILSHCKSNNRQEISIIVPVYLMITDLHLKNTLLGIVIPQVALGLSFGIFLLTTFFKEVPKELIEASVVDGCNDRTILYNVILPLSMPSIKALAIIEFLWAWNSFFFPLVLVQDTEVMPMSVRIIDFMGRYLFNYGGIASVCIMMFLPIFILYLISQSNFHRGITLGGLKG